MVGYASFGKPLGTCIRRGEEGKVC